MNRMMGRAGLMGHSIGERYASMTRDAAWMDVDGQGIDPLSMYTARMPSLTGTGGGAITDATPAASPSGLVGTLLDRSGMPDGVQPYVDAHASDAVADYHFASGITGWTPQVATLEAVSSGLRLTATSAFGYAAYMLDATVTGPTMVEVSVTEFAGSSDFYVNVREGASQRAIGRSSGTGVHRFVMDIGHDADEVLLQRVDAAEAITFDYVKIVPLPGRHLIATSDGARPTLAADSSHLVWTSTESMATTAPAGGWNGTYFQRTETVEFGADINLAGGATLTGTGSDAAPNMLTLIVLRNRLTSGENTQFLATQF